MRRFVHLLVFMTTAAGAAAAQAQVTVSDAWVRGTVPGQTASGAYMQLKSADGATLVGAESPVAGIVEIHEMRTEGNTMRMRGVEKLALPAGRAVELKPGGYHVMLMDLKAPLKKGETVPIKLKVRSKSGQTQDIEVKAEVRDVTAGAGGPSKH
ncbi:MAG TPA: copper chaperone PCu(A)C [Burkholderiales bacterium]|nr:copper chaperone PCu(A)C [Burkholderiales bacterium]